MKVERIDTVFTFFGAGLPHPRRVRSVVTVAYPVICYPDSPYWRYIDWEKKARIRILNYLRRRRLKGASKIIAETEIMKSRLIRTLSCAQDKIIVIPPGPSDYVVSRCEDLGGKAFLFPSGNDSHKNLWRLYAVAQRLIERGMDDFVFVLTVDKKAYIKTLRESVINDKIVNERFRFLGTIEPQRIMDLYNMGDYVVSLSDLDSFSNNYMEAWKTGIPLIVSDRDFSRSICGDSAIYVEPHRTDDVADKFIAIVGDVELRSMLVRAGKERLKLLPNQKERFTRVMEEIITS
jgi:glycosyltransferase involved in cell wall biosynthesis